MASSSQAFDSWNSLNDSSVMDSSKTYRIQLSWSCPAGFGADANQLITAFQPYFPSVVVTEDTQARLDGMNNIMSLGMVSGFNVPDLWYADVTVADGLTVGDCRAVAQQALNDMSAAKAVPCGNFMVGNVSVLVPGVGIMNKVAQEVANATGAAAGASPSGGTVKWGFIAIVAIIALVLFNQVKEAV